MSGIATPELAAAVSNAGGLGMLGVGRPTLSTVKSQLDELESLTDRPVGVGLIVEFLDGEILDEVAARLPIIEFFWGWPEPSIVPADRIVGWQVGSVDEAIAAVDAGCHYVVAQGIEAGGHVRGTVELTDLVAAVRDALGDATAIVAAGGIGTATDVRAALARRGRRRPGRQPLRRHPRIRSPRSIRRASRRVGRGRYRAVRGVLGRVARRSAPRAHRLRRRLR